MARYARADETRTLRYDQARKAKGEKENMRRTLKAIRRLAAVAGLVILAGFSGGHIPASGQVVAIGLVKLPHPLDHVPQPARRLSASCFNYC